MHDIITIVHPQHGEAFVSRAQWGEKIPGGQHSSGWDEATARANGWAPKGEKTHPGFGVDMQPAAPAPVKPKAKTKP